MRRIFIALAALAALVTTAQADVYKSVDAQGQVHYSDQWSPGSELIKGSSSRPAAQEASPPPPANNATTPDQAKAAAAKQVQQDMDTVKADQCKQLKEQYDKLLRARRIYQSAPDGSDSSAPKQYLSDSEADAERVKTRQAMDEACGNSGG